MINYLDKYEANYKNVANFYNKNYNQAKYLSCLYWTKAYQ